MVSNKSQTGVQVTIWIGILKPKTGLKENNGITGKLMHFIFFFLSEVAGDAHVLPVGVGCEIFT